MVIEARKWPVAGIRGIISAGAYVGEKSPKELAKDRASHIEAYLLQLGIKKENIWTDTRLISKENAFNNGKFQAEQISVEFVPICEGGCSKLCNDPRVTPTSKALGDR